MAVPNGKGWENMPHPHNGSNYEVTCKGCGYRVAEELGGN